MKEKPKNISASNRAKLLNLSHQNGLSFLQEVQYFAMARFLYRLSQSSFASKFILKGAMLLHARELVQARTTLDIDFLGILDNSVESISRAIKIIISEPVEDDGLKFLSETIDVSAITKDAGYIGRRVNFRAMLDTIIIPMQIDIGFGDKVVPAPSLVETPALLGYSTGKIYGYVFETSVAEKVHTMMQLELLNSRMKDFYDVWLLIQENQINQNSMIDAIVGTFNARHLDIDLDSIIFSDEFLDSKEKQKQWVVFCRRKKLENIPITFSEVANEIFIFLKPILKMAKEKMQT